MFLSILPLRVPEPYYDLKLRLKDWLDDVQAPTADAGRQRRRVPDVTYAECLTDLHRLETVRNQVLRMLQSGNHRAVLQQLPLLQEYAALLAAFEECGFPQTDPDGVYNHGNARLEFAWKTVVVVVDDNSSHDSGAAATTPEDASALSLLNTTASFFRISGGVVDTRNEHVNDVPIETHSSFTWERCNVIYNIATLEAYKAMGTYKQPAASPSGMMMTTSNGEDDGKRSAADVATNTTTTFPLDSSKSWKEAKACLQNAACLVAYLHDKISTSMQEQQPSEQHPQQQQASSSSLMSSSAILNPFFLQVWQAMLMAESMRSYYHSAAQPKPKHVLCAKMAAGAVPLYRAIEEIVAKQQQDNHHGMLSSSMSTASTAATDHWSECARAWVQCMISMTQYHQAMVHNGKAEWYNELPRLHKAYEAAMTCRSLEESVRAIAPELLTQLPTLMTVELIQGMEQRIRTIQQENIDCHVNDPEQLRRANRKVPKMEDLPEITPQAGVVKVQIEQAAKCLPPLTEPIFRNRIHDPNCRRYVEQFQRNMDDRVSDYVQRGREKTDRGRKALAMVNLPHSLTAYKQELEGGGLPAHLWKRIQGVQQNRQMEQLKRDAWELRELAETARHIHAQIEKTLRDDLASDELFRQEHQDFEGHNVGQLQTTFRLNLQTFDKLMRKAQKGDETLLARCQVLDNDPKFRLLSFTKAQLDQLVPGQQQYGSAAIDVRKLSQYLVDLSGLFDARDGLIQQFREAVQEYQIHELLSKCAAEGADEDTYQEIVNQAVTYFDAYADDLENNMNQQDDLLRQILRENEVFMRARQQQQSSPGLTTSPFSSDSCIVKIADALEELDQFSKHLREGRAFYEIMNPKLQKLQDNVGSVSARLASARYDFVDKLSRQTAQQEEEERMQHQNFDDANVANLVSMGFSAESAVAALEKYNNNFDQALNDLLSQ